MRCKPGYTEILVESFYSPEKGHRGYIHIIPAASQQYSLDYLVECSRAMTNRYPVGTIFRLAVCLKATSGGRPHFYAHYRAPVEVVVGRERKLSAAMQTTTHITIPCSRPPRNIQ